MDLRVLNIYLGDMKDAIYHPPTYFDNQYEDEWLTDKTAIQMIRDVDHSEVISARLIDSPVLGPISPKELSGGVKTYEGKTTLINMLRQAENLGNSSGIEVSCDVPCRILEGSNWKLILEHTENRSPGRIYTDFHIV